MPSSQHSNTFVQGPARAWCVEHLYARLSADTARFTSVGDKRVVDDVGGTGVDSLRGFVW